MINGVLFFIFVSLAIIKLAGLKGFLLLLMFLATLGCIAYAIEGKDFLKHLD